MKTKPEDFEWDYDGACMPSNEKSDHNFRTFTLGIFQWIPKATKKGLKRSKVVSRVKGNSFDPDIAVKKAQQICAVLNEKFKRGVATAYLILNVEDEIKKIKQSWSK